MEGFKSKRQAEFHWCKKFYSHFIRPELDEMLKGIEFYDGVCRLVNKWLTMLKILPYICRVYFEANKANALTASQLPTAEICEMLTQAFSLVGITAFIYEQLGYEKFKHPEAFRILVESYMSAEVRKWAKEIPDEFYWQLDRIYGNQKTTSRKRPQYYAKFTRKYIYEPARKKASVLKQLDEKTQRIPKGNRAKRHHTLLK